MCGCLSENTRVSLHQSLSLSVCQAYPPVRKFVLPFLRISHGPLASVSLSLSVCQAIPPITACVFVREHMSLGHSEPNNVPPRVYPTHKGMRVCTGIPGVRVSQCQSLSVIVCPLCSSTRRRSAARWIDAKRHLNPV